MNRRTRKKLEKAYARPVIRALASRAIFQEAQGMLPKISMTFELTDGEVIQFELELEEAAKFIEQTVSAYNAAVPVLKTSRGGWGL